MKTARIFTYSFILGFVLMLSLAFVIFRSNRRKQRDNKLLAEQKEELMQQKEEILTTTEQLEKTNKELEKLSVVASKTDNAVSIMDGEGNYLWVNDGYIQMHGYSLDQLTEEIGPNIINSSLPSNVTDEILRCIEHKEAVIYEMNTQTRTGENLWVQSTLTPILEDKKIKTLVAVESDITKIKEVEKEIMVQRDTLKLQNQRIHSSIRYALTIQKAILPMQETLDKHFDTFVFYLPKDIVSGDFYWYSEVKGVNGAPDKIFIAAVDCTGHGVPGAFMSMIGSRLMNEIVNEKGVYAPSQILEQLNDGVYISLQQEQSDNNDGMDLSLCSIENISKGNYKVTYSGAERPLFYKRKGEKASKLKGDPKSIGGLLSKRDTTPFTDQEIILTPGDTIYLTSDGVIDQNDGNRMRFGTKRFVQFVEDFADKDMKVQHDELASQFEEYKKGEEQRDDVTVVGVKFR